MSYREVGRVVKVIGLGPVCWGGSIAGVVLPSFTVLAWWGIIIPGVMGLAGYTIEQVTKTREERKAPTEGGG